MLFYRFDWFWMETPETPQVERLDPSQEEYLWELWKIPQAFNDEIDHVLELSQNKEKAIEEFDRIILKLMRLVRYSINKNVSEETGTQEPDNEEKQSSVVDEQQTSNIIQRFVARFCRDLSHKKTVDEWMPVEQQPEENRAEEEKKNVQEEIFDYVCIFVNSFMVDQNISKVHNNIPKTSLENYSKKSIWEQLFQNLYLRDWWKDWISEWWSCSYWTILLYHFFNKLKEAWLDLNISFFRYKNVDDKILQGIKANRHSWLIVNFQWEDYMVDCEWLTYGKDRSVVKPLSICINNAYVDNRPDVAEFFEKFKDKKETSKIKFFDKEDEFIEHFEQYPPDYSILFHVKFPDKEKVEKVEFSFWWNTIFLKIDETEYTFYLKDNKDLREHNFDKILRNKLYIKNGRDYVTKEDQEMFKKYFDIIKNKINTGAIIKHYQRPKHCEKPETREATMATMLWGTKTIIYKNPYTKEIIF